MKRKDEPSKLAAAVEALERELLELDRLTESALKHPLDSEKHIQQTASSLQGIGAMEERIRGSMTALTVALGELGRNQQDRVQKAAARAEELKARHDVFLSLMERYRTLGASAGELQHTLADLSTDAQVTAAMPGVLDVVGKLVDESAALEAAAEKDAFIDVARHAKSLRQQLGSLHATMLRRVGH